MILLRLACGVACALARCAIANPLSRAMFYSLSPAAQLKNPYLKEGMLDGE